MSNLERLLAGRMMSRRQMKNVLETNIIHEESSGKIYFTMKVKTGKIKKDESEQTRLYKNDITKMVRNHGGLENLFRALIATEMMLAGYIIVPIDGGYLCIGGDEIYNLKDETCTCRAFLNNPSEPCKHLLYKDALLDQRARINQWRMANL